MVITHIGYEPHDLTKYFSYQLFMHCMSVTIVISACRQYTHLQFMHYSTHLNHISCAFKSCNAQMTSISKYYSKHALSTNVSHLSWWNIIFDSQLFYQRIFHDYRFIRFYTPTWRRTKRSITFKCYSYKISEMIKIMTTILFTFRFTEVSELSLLKVRMTLNYSTTKSTHNDVGSTHTHIYIAL